MASLTRQRSVRSGRRLFSKGKYPENENVYLYVPSRGKEKEMTILYKKYRKYYYLFIAPAFVLYVMALLMPLFLGTIPYSFQKWNLMTGARSFTGIDNYIKLLSDTSFWQAFLFNISIGIWTIIGSNVLGFFIAYFLNKNIRAKGLIRALFFIPNIISAVLVAFIWTFIFAQILPNLAEIMGWDWLGSISWFGNPETASFTIILVSIWQQIGFLMIIYTAGLQTVPTELIEAGKMDGCTGFKLVRYIQLPLLMPTITINLFVSISGAFKAFDVPNAMTAGGPYGSTMTAAMDIYQEAFVKYNLGYGAAKSVVLFVAVAAVTLIQLHFTRKREVEL